jgi:hypothetical protein
MVVADGPAPNRYGATFSAFLSPASASVTELSPLTRSALTRLALCFALPALVTVPAAAHAGCCIVADNGLATATLPPLTTGATCVYLGTTEITS